MSEEMKLKPCPFCGGEAVVTCGSKLRANVIQCMECGAEVSGSRGAILRGSEYIINGDADGRWNTRTQPRQMPSEDVNDTNVVEINTQLIADFKSCSQIAKDSLPYTPDHIPRMAFYMILALAEKYKQLFEEVK